MASDGCTVKNVLWQDGSTWIHITQISLLLFLFPFIEKLYPPVCSIEPNCKPKTIGQRIAITGKVEQKVRVVFYIGKKEKFNWRTQHGLIKSIGIKEKRTNNNAVATKSFFCKQGIMLYRILTEGKSFLKWQPTISL